MSELTGSSVTIKDIALAADVSPSTVSRALHNHDTISLGTKQRIRRLAQEMGYVPSLPARSLVTRDTATIGLVITYVSDPFIARLVLGVEETAQQHGYTVYAQSSYRDAEVEKQVVHSFYERRASGIVITGSEVDAEYVEMRDRFPLPIVLTNCPAYPYSISTNNRAGGGLAAEHLLLLGHRRIAYIANHQSYGTNRDRFDGFQTELGRHGAAIGPERVLEGDGTLDGGARVGQALLAMEERPTAVFCFNDLTAIGVIHALAEAGIKVPDDCSVVGFDDLELASYYCPPLTTIRQPSFRIGQQAMQMLLRMIQGEWDLEAEVLPAELIVRGTTGPAVH